MQSRKESYLNVLLRHSLTVTAASALVSLVSSDAAIFTGMYTVVESLWSKVGLRMWPSHTCLEFFLTPLALSAVAHAHTASVLAPPPLFVLNTRIKKTWKLSHIDFPERQSRENGSARQREGQWQEVRLMDAGIYQLWKAKVRLIYLSTRAYRTYRDSVHTPSRILK